MTDVEKQVGSGLLKIQTGRVAKQADGAVTVQYGDTVVLVTAVAQEMKEDKGFFPLIVEYRAKHYAAGKIPGGRYSKREGRPGTKEVLIARLIDRPIRPLFPEGYGDEVQVYVTVLSYDGENDPDVLSLIGASAALGVSDIPFNGPLGAVRVGRIDDSEMPDLGIVRRRYLLGRVLATGKDHSHVRLSGTEPDLADKNVSYGFVSRGRDQFHVVRRGIRLHGLQRGCPLAVVAGLCGFLLSLEAKDHVFARLSPPPNRHRHVALYHHVVAEEVRQTEMGGSVSAVTFAGQIEGEGHRSHVSRSSGQRVLPTRTLLDAIHMHAGRLQEISEGVAGQFHGSVLEERVDFSIRSNG